MRKSKFVIILLGILMLAAFGITGIHAYLTDADTAENKVTIGGNRIRIEEEFIPPAELKPGISFTKNVKVTNEGSVECFVRIKAVFTDSDMEKYCDVDFNVKTAENPNGEWIYHEEDGYYYYPKVLYVTDTTPSLFTTVTVKENYDSDGDGTFDTKVDVTALDNFDILVYAESYQAYDTESSACFKNYVDAWEHYTRNKPKE